MKRNIRNFPNGCIRFSIFLYSVWELPCSSIWYLHLCRDGWGWNSRGRSSCWPQKEMHILGVDFTWSLLGYNVLRDARGAVIIGGGLGYFISYEVGSFLAQCINFPLQRNITFKSKGNPVYQAMWYFIAWIVISLICNGFNNLWMPIASAYVPPAIYNLLVTFITGGVSMVIFFFVFKTSSRRGNRKKRNRRQIKMYNNMQI